VRTGPGFGLPLSFVGGTELLEGFAGAVFAFIFAACYGEFERHRRRKATRLALATEIATIVQLIQANGYIGLLEDHAQLYAAPDAPEAVVDPFVITAREGYFKVYEASASSIGDLSEELAMSIVSFYQGASALIDTFSSEGAAVQVGIPAPAAVGFYRTLATRMRNLITLGNNIVPRLAGSDYLPKIQKAAAELLVKFETPVGSPQGARE